MNNTANYPKDTLNVAHPFDTCPACKQIVRVTANVRIAKHGGKFSTCKGTGLTAPSFVVSVEPVEIVSVTEVEDEDPEQTEYLRETYGTGGWQ